MPWKQETVMSLRKEFVALAHSGALPFSQLCQRFEISRKPAINGSRELL